MHCVWSESYASQGNVWRKKKVSALIWRRRKKWLKAEIYFLRQHFLPFLTLFRICLGNMFNIFSWIIRKNRKNNWELRLILLGQHVLLLPAWVPFLLRWLAFSFALTWQKINLLGTNFYTRKQPLIFLQSDANLDLFEAIFERF